MITRTLAENLYRIGNNAGQGYAPYAESAADETIDAAIAAAEADGWTLVLEREDSQTVAVLENEDLELLAIGGDGMGDGAWAVVLTDVAGCDLTPRGLDRWHDEAAAAGDTGLLQTIRTIREGTGRAQARAMEEMRDLWCEASGERLAAELETR